MSTFNRGQLKRLIIKGKVEVKCDGRYTDDYAGDAADNFGITAWKKAAYFPSFWSWLDEKGLHEEFSQRLEAIRTGDASPSEKAAQDHFARQDYTKMYDEQKSAVVPAGTICFDEGDFKGHGSAWTREDGSISLSYGYVSYSLRIIA